MDRLTAAQVFVDVAYTQSFTATAERLDMSRPMVTRYVELMESWLQARLFHRTTRKVSLTSAGQECLPEVESWIKSAHSLVADTRPSGQLSGCIKISVGTAFCYAQAMPALVEFMNQHPDLILDLDLQDTATDLVEDRVDLAIRIASDPAPSLIGKPIAVCKSVIVASPEYLASAGSIKEPHDLSALRCLGHKNVGTHVWHFSKQDQYQAVKINCHLTTNDAYALLLAAKQGAGVAMQPTFLANTAIANGSLVRLIPDWEVDDMKIYAFYSSRKHLSSSVRVLIDFLADYFRLNSWDDL